MIFHALLSAAAAILLYTGLLFLTLALRQSDRRLYLRFALVSILFGVHLVCKLVAIEFSTIPTLMNLLKLDAFFDFLGAGVWVWLIAEYTQVKPLPLLRLTSGIYFGLAGLNLVLPYGTFMSGIVELREVVFPWGEKFNYLIGTPHPLSILGAFNGLVVFGFAFYACFRQYQRGEPTKAKMLAIGIGGIFLSFVHIYLADLGILANLLSFSTAPYTFLLMVMVMSVQLTGEIVATRSQLQYYNQHLEEVLENRTQQLAEKIEQTTLLKERNRITAELHDSVNQNLHSLVMIADSLPKLWENHPQEIPSGLEKISQIAQGALIQMRNLLNELSPQRLLEKPLGQLLQQLSQEMASQAHFKLTTCIGPDCILPPKVQITFYRIAQEAMNNIVRHAQAQQVEIHFNCHHFQHSDKQVYLLIKDDGVGFEKEKSLPDHLGLTIMQQRARKIGATLTITTQSLQGTEISVIWSS